MPTPRFLKDMGVASIIAGAVLLGLSHVASKGRRLR
jgi:hypothetical protein